ncbi:TRAF3-interacting JNK-activating modulator [Erythrolamprus reginae]|uniref:TRAF3-interacting JNK-activating modulator n=1 Tax=Erythrolamprus reginae TaxID=121349 RepID=UPI00396C4A95
MITGFAKSPGQQGRQHESYEEKYERRCKKHESLLRRNNSPTCHLTAKCQSKEAKEPVLSPRQKEFFRRRNLTTEELGRTKMMLSPGKRGSSFPVNCSDNLGEIPPQTYLNYLSNIQEVESQLYLKSVVGRMITGFAKSPGQQGRQHESYEEKHERQCNKHESLLRINNSPTCHLTAKCQSKEAKEPVLNPRQKEFFRRRNLTTEELGRTKMMLSPGKRGSSFPVNCSDNLGEIPPQTYLNYLSNIQPHTKSIQHDFSNIFPLSKSSQAMLVVNVPQNCKSTQTTKELSSEKKNSYQQTDCGAEILDKEITQLSNYLNEALHRELVLKQKMAILQELLAMLLEAAEKSWKGQFNEDKLKCRLTMLENQLQICTQSYSKRGLKRILLEMEDQKQNYEQKVKESLQKLLEEKTQAQKQFQNAQRALTVAEDNCNLWKDQLDNLQKDWSQLTDQHSEVKNKLHALENKLQWSDTQNSQLQQTLKDMENECANLYSRIDHLQEEKRLIMEYLGEVEGKLQTEEKQKLILVAKTEHLQKQIATVPNELLSWVTTKQNVQSLDHEGEKESSLREELQKRTSQLAAKRKECTDLCHKLEILNNKYSSCLENLQHCLDELKHSQSKPIQRNYKHWIPIIMVIMVTALVCYLSNFIP